MSEKEEKSTAEALSTNIKHICENMRERIKDIYLQERNEEGALPIAVGLGVDNAANVLKAAQILQQDGDIVMVVRCLCHSLALQIKSALVIDKETFPNSYKGKMKACHSVLFFIFIFNINVLYT